PKNPSNDVDRASNIVTELQISLLHGSQTNLVAQPAHTTILAFLTKGNELASNSAASSRQTPPEPISIPRTPLHRRDPNRVPTPVSGRGDRIGHQFPHRDISPLRLSQSPTESRASSPPPNVPSSLSQHFSHLNTRMHTERPSYFYKPTSPLSSPRTTAIHPRPISPQPSVQSRRQHNLSPNSKSKQPSKMPLPGLPRFHPARFESVTSSPSIAADAVADSPKAMRKYQRELLAKADYSSRLAASPFSNKPSAPRLDPLGSPGPVTPLELEETEEAGDYFTAGRTVSIVQNAKRDSLDGDQSAPGESDVKTGSPKVRNRGLEGR
ncbi:MAG: hypothetical protein Q9160_008685, partial [Pyrenula sp. 1 TL-2023]